MTNVDISNQNSIVSIEKKIIIAFRFGIFFDSKILCLCFSWIFGLDSKPIFFDYTSFSFFQSLVVFLIIILALRIIGCALLFPICIGSFFFLFTTVVRWFLTFAIFFSFLLLGPFLLEHLPLPFIDLVEQFFNVSILFLKTFRLVDSPHPVVHLQVQSEWHRGNDTCGIENTPPNVWLTVSIAIEKCTLICQEFHNNSDDVAQSSDCHHTPHPESVMDWICNAIHRQNLSQKSDSKQAQIGV